MSTILPFPAAPAAAEAVEPMLWHPVAESASVAGDRPLAARLLERDLVLWRDAAGRPHAWADRCPHRGARLSLGRVTQDALECPYHGWRFDADARCVAVPALPAFRPPATHVACAHEAVDAQGLVWVRLESPRGRAAEALPAAWTDAPPAFAEGADPALRRVLCGPFDVESSAPRVVENFLDMSHFGLVHEGWLGDRAHLDVADGRVARDADGTLRATGCRAWQPRSNRLATGGSFVDYGYAVPSPYGAVLTKAPEAQPGYRDAIALFVCPVEPERCRAWFLMALTDHASTEHEIRAFQDTIFAQDRPVLESQRPKRLPLSPGAELHSAADRMSAAYRRLLRDTGIRFGTC